MSVATSNVSGSSGNGNAIANPAKSQPAKSMSIRDHLNSQGMKAELARVLPTHCKPDRMIRVALTALTRTPMLADCDQASFFKCLLDLSQWGLEPDGRRAHLIPFRNNKRNVVECQLIIDYKGLVELAYNSGVVAAIHADVVRDGDIFDFNLGRIVKHVPWFLRRDADRPENPGEVFAAYCHCELKDGASKTEVMSAQEVEGIRKRSKAGSHGPWVTDWTEMAKKTVFRRLTKWLPLSAEVRDAFDRDDDRFEDVANANRPALNAPNTVDDLANIFAHGALESQAVSLPSELTEALQACQSPDEITAFFKSLPSMGEAEMKALNELALKREDEIINGK